jgi:pimeloyl-ACP methyl ester carboxylesterase
MQQGYTPVLDADLVLSDGRNLAYAIWGDPDGRPMFFCHGSPSSRLYAPDPATTAEDGVRLVTMDRPGFGRSDPQPGRYILDWPADVEQLADALGIQTFDVVGPSSGGPYALACALKLPGRIRCVALVSSIAPVEELHPDGLTGDDDDTAITRLARQDPARATTLIAENGAWLLETPEAFLDIPRQEPDVRLLRDPDVRAMFINSIREAVRQGLDAYAWDSVLERRHWGFRLAEIGLEVSIFQGEQDWGIPVSEAEVLAAALPHSHLRLFPDAGHGLILAGWADIMSDLNS